MQELNRLVKNASDEGKWITIKPHGEDSEDYRRIKLEDNETPKEAIERIYKKGVDKKKELTEKIRNLTKDKFDKKQYYEKIEKENTKLYNAYQKLQRTKFIINGDNIASEEEIENAYDKFSKKRDERNELVKNYNKITNDL